MSEEFSEELFIQRYYIDSMRSMIEVELVGPGREQTVWVPAEEFYKLEANTGKKVRVIYSEDRRSARLEEIAR